jgi:AcrR family transcriptional regulator
MPIARRKEQLRPRKRPVQARSQRTVDVVLEAAARVFARRGYAGATTNHIAERAGVSIGSLYEYFPSKDAILVALLEAHIRDGEAVLVRAASEIAGKNLGLVATVRHLVRAMVELHGHDRDLHRVLFEEAPLPRHVRELLAAMGVRIGERTALMLRSLSEVTVRDPALAAAVVVKTVEALTHNLVVHGDGNGHRELDVYVEEIVRLVARYLTAPVGSQTQG